MQMTKTASAWTKSNMLSMRAHIDARIHDAATEELEIGERPFLDYIPSPHPLKFGGSLLPELIGMHFRELQVLSKRFRRTHCSPLRLPKRQGLLRDVGEGGLFLVRRFVGH